MSFIFDTQIMLSFGNFHLIAKQVNRDGVWFFTGKWIVKNLGKVWLINKGVEFSHILFGTDGL